jgi:hypothetical protein
MVDECFVSALGGLMSIVAKDLTIKLSPIAND